MRVLERARVRASVCVFAHGCALTYVSVRVSARVWRYDSPPLEGLGMGMWVL